MNSAMFFLAQRRYPLASQAYFPIVFLKFRRASFTTFAICTTPMGKYPKSVASTRETVQRFMNQLHFALNTGLVVYFSTKLFQARAFCPKETTEYAEPLWYVLSFFDYIFNHLCT